MSTLRLGSKGPETGAWQRALNTHGFHLVVDEVFGKKTHNATIAFQASHGLLITGEVDFNERQVMAAPAIGSIRPPPVLAHTIPFVEARHHGRVPRAVVDLIVLHCMEAPESSTRAESCAQYFASLPPGREFWKSAHYCVDSDTVIQCVHDHLVAYAAPGANQTGLQVELAGYARQTPQEWADDFSARMLWLAAQLTARKCRERDIPAEFLPAAKLLGPRPRGITTHYEVSKAFKKSDHTDPGKGFPIERFIAQVQMLLQDPQDIA